MQHVTSGVNAAGILLVARCILVTMLVTDGMHTGSCAVWCLDL